MSVDDILNGKAEAPNETVEYLAQQCKILRAQAADYETKAVETRGAFKKAMHDLKVWVEKAEQSDD